MGQLRPRQVKQAGINKSCVSCAFSETVRQRRTVYPSTSGNDPLSRHCMSTGFVDHRLTILAPPDSRPITVEEAEQLEWPDQGPCTVYRPAASPIWCRR